MITLDLNIESKTKNVKIKEDVLFNALLVEHPNMIKRIIKNIYPKYKISDAFFEIINKYIDFTDEGYSLYAGLIVRTNLEDYAVLYLENADIDEDYIVSLVDEYIHDINDYTPKSVNINKFEVNKSVFLEAIKNI